jgi:hypothetical protein
MKISNDSVSMSQIYTQNAAETSGQALVIPSESSATRPAPVESLPETDKHDNPKVRGENGVLRLLQEGHFKPHVEMRLLEIFHRDLAILQAQNAPEEPAPEETAPLPEPEL